MRRAPRPSPRGKSNRNTFNNYNRKQQTFHNIRMGYYKQVWDVSMTLLMTLLTLVVTLLFYTNNNSSTTSLLPNVGVDFFAAYFNLECDYSGAGWKVGRSGGCVAP